MDGGKVLSDIFQSDAMTTMKFKSSVLLSSECTVDSTLEKALILCSL